MDFTVWLSLFSICLLAAMSPGPSLAVVLNGTLAAGQRAGYAIAIGHALGIALYGVLTVTGLAVLIARSPLLFLGMQGLGALYLIYLGIGSLQRGRGVSLPSAGQPLGEGAFRKGFFVALLNPKAAVFMLALFSQFLEPTAGWLSKSVMVTTLGVVDAAWYCVVVALVSRRALLEKLQRSAGLIDRVFGVILIALALTVLLRIGLSVAA